MVCANDARMAVRRALGYPTDVDLAARTARRQLPIGGGLIASNKFQSSSIPCTPSCSRSGQRPPGLLRGAVRVGVTEVDAHSTSDAADAGGCMMLSRLGR